MHSGQCYTICKQGERERDKYFLKLKKLYIYIYIYIYISRIIIFLFHSLLSFLLLHIFKIYIYIELYLEPISHYVNRFIYIQGFSHSMALKSGGRARGCIFSHMKIHI
jgi:hypothetical protein